MDGFKVTITKEMVSLAKKHLEDNHKPYGRPEEVALALYWMVTEGKTSEPESSPLFHALIEAVTELRRDRIGGANQP